MQYLPVDLLNRSYPNYLFYPKYPSLLVILYIKVKSAISVGQTYRPPPPPSTNLGHPPKCLPKRFSDDLEQKNIFLLQNDPKNVFVLRDGAILTLPPRRPPLLPLKNGPPQNLLQNVFQSI